MRTLNELSHLKETGYGQPYPRYGLSLLWWFAHECVEIDDDGNMISRYDLEDEDFAEEFHNYEELLPIYEPPTPYYELGNLHNPGIMPHHVTQNYDPDVLESNADRIIVSVASDCNDKFDRIYVTHHIGKGGFDENSTYRISQGLIEIIQRMERSEFIRAVKVKQRRNRRRHRR